MTTDKPNLAREVKAFIRSNGVAWPGGYPCAMVMADGRYIDARSARENFRLILQALRQRGTDLQWEPYQLIIHWEGVPLICDHSGRAIESAYGDNLEN